MRSPLTIGRLMVVVAVAALDLALVRLFLTTGEGLGGLLAVGLAVSVALSLVVLGRGPVRGFGAGFLAGMVALIVGLITLALFKPQLGNRLFPGYLNGVFRLLHQSLGPFLGNAEHVRRSPIPFFLIAEAAIGLPLIAIACLGGLVGLAAARRRMGSQAAMTTVGSP